MLRANRKVNVAGRDGMVDREGESQVQHDAKRERVKRNTMRRARRPSAARRREQGQRARTESEGKMERHSRTAVQTPSDSSQDQNGAT